MKKPVSPEEITEKILLFRDKKVMLDTDLAKLYGVPTKSLNLAVKRNIDRFPLDFMFQLDEKEAETLRFQNETSKDGRGGRRYLPMYSQNKALLCFQASLIASGQFKSI